MITATMQVVGLHVAEGLVAVGQITGLVAFFAVVVCLKKQAQHRFRRC